MYDAEHVIRSVVLESLSKQHSPSSVDKLIDAYEKRYGKKIHHWQKLKTDLTHVMHSELETKEILSRNVLDLALKNGLDHLYVSSDPTAKAFRSTVLKQKQKNFMKRVYNTFS
ncbi:hypothetical protein COT72_02425 [archaeon CG10_big_fil_rev_8_21_14_0_10_43_11]|nr:MAG: hypothetical protein COT72_02425 [archaeon CG10_big_fil_rev_8_21_14_0_10_43_11]